MKNDRTVNLKLLLCLTLVLGGILSGCSTLIHGVNLSASKEQIRASILKITPLGTPLEKAKTLIQTKPHPVTFVYYKDTRGLWGTRIPTGGGGEYYGKAIGCEIGIGGYLANEIVDGMWVFDDKERLVYLFIYKEPNLP